MRGANRAVIAQQVAGTLTADMRTTIVVLLLDLHSGAALWAHVGDSRLYRWHDARLLGRTRDQTLEERLRDAGLSGTTTAPGQLTSALGSPEGFDFEVLETPQKLASGDALLLCSDGLWSAFDDLAMSRSVIGCSGVQAWLERLEAAVQQADRSDQDNYSALAIWCTGRLNIQQFQQQRRLRGPAASRGCILRSVRAATRGWPVATASLGRWNSRAERGGRAAIASRALRALRGRAQQRGEPCSALAR